MLLYFELSQPIHQRGIKVETTFIVNFRQRCFNVDTWLKIKDEPTYIYRRCFNFEMRLTFLR